ncbi:MAG TPA: alpha-hydroxy acid oxidase [Xanthobacteraceae bacterium]|nr:alpha-hydroxy acid oxidase [Xanthobacteraceae bacterium]
MDERATAPVEAAPRVAAPRLDEALHRRFPTFADLRRHARRRLPRFGFEYLDGGAGTDGGIARNAAALDAIELVPRYGVEAGRVPIEVELFGRRYAAPIGVAPMGGTGVVWPGAEFHLAGACQRAGVPYVASTVAGATIERIAEIAPDVVWFQLYRLAKNDHAIGFDLVRRAEAAGAHVLVLTLDVPARTTRPREVRNRLVIPFRPDLRTLYEAAKSPGWVRALMRHGIPRFANLASYAGKKPTTADVMLFARNEMGGGFTWEEVARFRDRWRGPLVVKGILHPQDARKAVALGADGVQVSNHGGRQIEAAPAAIDVLPAIVAAVGGRATVLMDSGIRSGLDVVRALALGAAGTFAGKAFLYALGALGADGPPYAIALLMEDIQAAARQLGARALADLRSVAARHPGAFRFPEE